MIRKSEWCKDDEHKICKNSACECACHDKMEKCLRCRIATRGNRMNCSAENPKHIFGSDVVYRRVPWNECSIVIFNDHYAFGCVERNLMLNVTAYDAAVKYPLPRDTGETYELVADRLLEEYQIIHKPCDATIFDGVKCVLPRGHDGNHKTAKGMVFNHSLRCDVAAVNGDKCTLLRGHECAHETANGKMFTDVDVITQQCEATLPGRPCILAKSHPGKHVTREGTEFETQTDANATQVGGLHYVKLGEFQPWDACWAWSLNFFQGAILKYVVRYRDKNGVEDLRKARHYIDKLIELEEKKK